MTAMDFVHKTLAIKNPPDFHVVSTFSGGGGSSTGYVWAGGKVLLAVEWDDNAVATYRLNYPDTDIYHGDIARLSVEEVLRRTGLRPGELDILDGSPPCQGFSTAGKRMLDDPRNQLFQEYVRLLRGLRPKVFVMENVSGMVKGKMKLLFAEIMRELKASGYKVKAKLLNAKYLGVPQSRERMIFIGVRDDLGIEPSHPKPQTKPITSGEAFHLLGDDPSARVCLPETSKTYQQVARVAPGEHCKLHYSNYRLAEHKVSDTIKRGGGAGAYHVWHWQGNRPITTHEVKRLASYPDCYAFRDVISCFAIIGNSVPPRMMQYIAEHIRDNIIAKVTT